MGEVVLDHLERYCVGEDFVIQRQLGSGILRFLYPLFFFRFVTEAFEFIERMGRSDYGVVPVDHACKVMEHLRFRVDIGAPSQEAGVLIRGLVGRRVAVQIWIPRPHLGELAVTFVADSQGR